MHIPIENIYYLLCYAWNRLQEKEQVRISGGEYFQLQDLFARILINGTKILIKRGIDFDYVTKTVHYSGVKGKLELSPTLKSGILLHQKTICTVDEFSGNVLTNRILLTTLLGLIQTEGLDKKLVVEMKALIWKFPGIEPITLSNRVFSEIKIHRNNHFYKFLLDICRIIFNNSLPTENPGELHFKDFTRDENQMNKLFEDFLLNFYRINFPHWKVKSEHINWKFKAESISNMDFVPVMRTDISITNGDKKTIIDAKYYREALSVHFGNQKLKSENLYQLFSYLMNQRTHDTRTIETRGILIYPTIDYELNLEYFYENHQISIKTVNLKMNWKRIEDRLKEIVA